MAPDSLDGAPSRDLQVVFTTLARRAKLPTRPEARPTEVLRAAGLPLLMAAIVAGGQSAPGAVDGGESGSAPGSPQPGVSSWTVTTLKQRPAQAGTTAQGKAPAGKGSAGKGSAGKDTVGKDTAKGSTAPPAATGTATPTRTYIVRPGDSLISISQRQQARLHDILELNRLHLESIIHPGDLLALPPLEAPGTLRTRSYPPAVTAAAEANRRALAQASVPSRTQVKAMIVSAARSLGVDPALALGVAYLESGFQQRMVSPANAVGVMQIVPSTGRWASAAVGRPLDLMDAKDNILAGVTLLHALVQAADTEPQAISGYYQGLSSVHRNGMFDDTRRFVANVQTLEARFAAET